MQIEEQEITDEGVLRVLVVDPEFGRTLELKITDEGLIIDAYVTGRNEDNESEPELVATAWKTFDDLYGEAH